MGTQSEYSVSDKLTNEYNEYSVSVQLVQQQHPENI
jgi:hypothetical protein